MSEKMPCNDPNQDVIPKNKKEIFEPELRRQHGTGCKITDSEFQIKDKRFREIGLAISEKTLHESSPVKNLLLNRIRSKNYTVRKERLGYEERRRQSRFNERVVSEAEWEEELENSSAFGKMIKSNIRKNRIKRNIDDMTPSDSIEAYYKTYAASNMIKTWIRPTIGWSIECEGSTKRNKAYMQIKDISSLHVETGLDHRW